MICFAFLKYFFYDFEASGRKAMEEAEPRLETQVFHSQFDKFG